MSGGQRSTNVELVLVTVEVPVHKGENSKAVYWDEAIVREAARTDEVQIYAEKIVRRRLRGDHDPIF